MASCHHQPRSPSGGRRRQWHASVWPRCDCLSLHQSACPPACLSVCLHCTATAYTDLDWASSHSAFPESMSDAHNRLEPDVWWARLQLNPASCGVCGMQHLFRKCCCSLLVYAAMASAPQDFCRLPPFTVMLLCYHMLLWSGAAQCGKGGSWLLPATPAIVGAASRAALGSRAAAGGRKGMALTLCISQLPSQCCLFSSP